MNGSSGVAAMVASRDPLSTQWPASWRLHPVDPDSKKKSNERVEDIGEMLIEQLMHWHDANSGTWPDQIIMYRDGLSEGQFDMCKKQEIEWMTTALSKHFADKIDELSSPTGYLHGEAQQLPLSWQRQRV